MFVPKRTKYRKMQKGRSLTRSFENRGTVLEYGTVGLKATEVSRITSRQIEAARRVLLRYIQKGGKIWIRVFPDKPVSKKPPEVRMGMGKGDVDHYVFQIKPGRIIYEISGIPTNKAVEALKQASYKLPFKTKIIIKENSSASMN